MFFLYRAGHHRDLHSFPTRRSSDLALSLEALSPEAIICDVGYPKNLLPGFAPAEGAVFLGGLGQVRGRLRLHPDLRSEEHTSELQSRRDIVCRLLLEKKNSTPPPTA